MAISKRAQEALKRVYGRIRKEDFSSNMEAKVEKIFCIIEGEYEKEGGDVNDLPGIK